MGSIYYTTILLLYPLLPVFQCYVCHTGFTVFCYTTQKNDLATAGWISRSIKGTLDLGLNFKLGEPLVVL